MKLERLEISGFKSFVEPLEVRFAAGITGIVGPNGCGKSNLTDAITWVLGEQSAKTLRADTMEDVIFNGSESRRPLGMAEVTLALSVPPGHPGAEEGKILLSRRVFRTGESLYRLNGRTVRLKDIRDLLFDTGLGLRAYSIIEQGKIGMILSGKPQERRRLIEEAAGITRYRVRRQHAEVKLEEAAANLLRLDDILAEVERNVRSLRRQAGAAKRFQERRQALMELERLWLGKKLFRLESSLAQCNSTLQERQDIEAREIALLTQAEAGLASAREALDATAISISEVERKLSALVADLAAKREQLLAAERNRHDVSIRLQEGGERHRARQRDRESLRARLDTLEQELRDLERERESVTTRVLDDDRALDLLEEQARNGEASLRSARDRLLATSGELERVRAQVHRAQLDCERVSLGVQHLQSRLEAGRLELAQLGEERHQAAEFSARARAELERLAAELDQARAGLEKLLAREATLGDELRAGEARWAARCERRRGLVELLEQGRQDAAALLDRFQQLGLGTTRQLAPLLRAIPGWERSLDFFLDRYAEALVLEDSPSLADAVFRLTQEESFPGLVLLRPGAHADAPPGLAAEEPDIVGTLGWALGLPPELAQALPPAYLARTPAAAEQLARRHPGVAFLAPTGTWFLGGTAHVAGKEEAGGYLTRSSELTDLDQELARLGDELDRLRATIEEVVAARSAAASEIHRLQDALAIAQQREASARGRAEQLANQEDRIRKQELELAVELESLSRELLRHQSAQALLAEEQARIEARSRAEEASVDQLTLEFERLRQERELARARGAGQRGALDLLLERSRARHAERDRILADLDRFELEEADWTQQAAQLEAHAQELDHRLEVLRNEIRLLEDSRAGREAELVKSLEELERQRALLRQQEGALVDQRARLETVRAQVAEMRVLQAGLEHDRAHLLEQIASSKDPTVGTVVSGLEEATEEEIEVLGERCQRLRAEIESMGPVNVLAAEELAQEEERLSNLTAQRADVARSIESLRQTIRDINRTSSERFRETFAQVNEQFHRTFAELFRGGEAEMRLLDEDDPLESVIEIVARPPGKRLQNLMLLSGGEKALTAIALLFALFRIKPSPFCILDEVDAPLDEVNTLRFVTLLRQLARETQVLVVTHNKLTMEACSRLFGVTMEERGVSKLVEVELSEIFPELELATATVG